MYATDARRVTTELQAIGDRLEETTACSIFMETSLLMLTMHEKGGDICMCIYIYIILLCGFNMV